MGRPTTAEKLAIFARRVVYSETRCSKRRNSIMKVAENVVEVLKLLMRSDGEVSVSEVARHLGLNRSTASRLLASLRKEGLLLQDSRSAKYQLGVLAIQLGAFAQQSFNYFDWVHSCLPELVEDAKRTACIGLLDGAELVIADSHRHRDNAVNLSFDIGARIPADISSLGKVLLARKSQPELTELLKDSPNKDKFLPKVEKIRHEGFAMSRNELAHGVVSYAVCLTGDPRLEIAVGIAMLSSPETQEDEGRVKKALLNFKTRMEARPGR
ncbi:IclR family transcriptional regulator [Brucella tritici]|uniref:IclR family transcriptional regulator n=2 Tax=Brucella tritici TaxID=94626 RepID=A0A833FPB6_9HYPH|nr:IclR family transcriptional regulator [Brucella tritici]KAB2675718.1 IclR family transcriptional regulator [Brucella tritici]